MNSQPAAAACASAAAVASEPVDSMRARSVDLNSCKSAFELVGDDFECG